jgi:hypothetical protein
VVRMLDEPCSIADTDRWGQPGELRICACHIVQIVTFIPWSGWYVQSAETVLPRVVSSHEADCIPSSARVEDNRAITSLGTPTVPSTQIIESKTASPTVP